MSDQRRRCPGHPEDAGTAHFWDALTGLPTDSGASEPSFLESPAPAESVCPRHSPVRRAMKRIYDSNRRLFEKLRKV